MDQVTNSSFHLHKQLDDIFKSFSLAVAETRFTNPSPAPRPLNVCTRTED